MPSGAGGRQVADNFNINACDEPEHRPQRGEMEPKSIRFIRLPEVKQRTGLGKTTLYGMVKDGEFPAPVKIGGRAVAWVDSEIDHWAAARLADRVTPEQLSQLS